MTDSARAIEAVWRIESSRIVATLARVTGDFGFAEDLAQEALIEALEQWPNAGTPRNPGAWLTMVAKRRAIDAWRRRSALADRTDAIAHDLEEVREVAWEPIGDDVLRLIFTACHPVLSREAQIPLTLKVVSGLTTQEIARVLLVSVPTVQARITRAKKTLAAARVPFEAPDPAEWPERLSAVLGVVYLLFTEGYAATTGSSWLRTDLTQEALRLGRMLSAMAPRSPTPTHSWRSWSSRPPASRRESTPTAPRCCSPTRCAHGGIVSRSRAGRRRLLGPTRSDAHAAVTRCRRRWRSATPRRARSRTRTGSGS